MDILNSAFGYQTSFVIMKIGIDARLIGETGVGRYIRNLITNLSVQDKSNEYVLYLRDAHYRSFVLPGERWSKVRAEVPWHSLKEQVLMPWFFMKSGLDLVHVPYFTIPIFYPGRMVVTIHDLTILHFDTGKATTLPWIVYKFRRLGYRIALAVGLFRARKIIAVSKTTKQEIIDHFHMNPGKIVVTYEGVDEQVKSQKSKVKSEDSIIREPYFLYVGNAYPHKNLETLLEAFGQIRNQESRIRNIKLVLVGKDDYFYSRLKKLVQEQRLADSTIFFGEADDGQLSHLYRHAQALVFPSLMEGFGLPALEALAFGCPVIASDIPVFHEILGDNAMYFHALDAGDLGEKLTYVLERHPVGQRRTTVRLQDRFSWSRLASDTLTIYEGCARV
ncbi:glycosyltransferase family 4 protein [Candidatus Gottesmanbacteria bacterium]|nr:glycosyltransferase family 4 protein [Candidatus Gottesmanbacteria bacterium]